MVIANFAIDFLIRLKIEVAKQRQQPHDAELEKKIESRVKVVKVEQHGDIYYWFDSDDAFLAQGSNLDEIVDKIKVRFPRVLFLVKVEDRSYALRGPDWKIQKIVN